MENHWKQKLKLIKYLENKANKHAKEFFQLLERKILG